MSPAVLILSFIVIACFVAGVALLFGGYANLPRADKSASREELEKSNQALQASRDDAAKIRLQLDSLVIQFEETKGKIEWAEKNTQSLDNLQKQAKDAQDKAEQIERDLSFLSQKADTQAREAIDVITRLAAENEIFQRNAEAAPAAAGSSATAGSEDLARLTDENEKFKIQVEGYANKLKELEAIAAAQPSAAVSASPAPANDKSPVDHKLAEENTNLKKSITELEEKIKLAQAETEKFRAEQAKQLEELKAKIVQLEGENKALPAASTPAAPSEEELKKVRQESEAKLTEANTGLTTLRNEMQTVKTQLADKDNQIQKLSEELRLSKEATAVTDSGKNEKDALQKRLQDLQKMNQFLMDKERILTFRLAQSRAQASGLEKICEEFKYQLEKK